MSVDFLFIFVADVNSQLEVFSDELARKTEESSRQKEEITSLLSQVVDLQRKNREVCIFCFIVLCFSLNFNITQTKKWNRLITDLRMKRNILAQNLDI